MWKDVPLIIKNIQKQWDTTYWLANGKDYKTGKYPNANKSKGNEHTPTLHTTNILV